MNTRQIAGEAIDAIGAALQHFTLEEPDEDGLVPVHAHAALAELAPLWRALMRVEAQMLLSDADDFPDTEDSCRTGAQRRHDALIRILTQLIDAYQAT